MCQEIKMTDLVCLESELRFHCFFTATVEMYTFRWMYIWMFHQEFHVPKQEVLKPYISAILWVDFPLHKPYPYSLYIGEVSSILGTRNVWWIFTKLLISLTSGSPILSWGQGFHVGSLRSLPDPYVCLFVKSSYIKLLGGSFPNWVQLVNVLKYDISGLKLFVSVFDQLLLFKRCSSSLPFGGWEDDFLLFYRLWLYWFP